MSAAKVVMVFGAMVAGCSAARNMGHNVSAGSIATATRQLQTAPAGGDILQRCENVDISGDGKADVQDILMALPQFHCAGTSCGGADVTGPEGAPDGVVNVHDLMKLMSAYVSGAWHWKAESTRG